MNAKPERQKLPGQLLLITARRLARRPLPEVVARALAGGCRWLLVREKDLPLDALASLLADLLPLARRAGAALSVALPSPASRWAERSTPRVPDAAGALQATLGLRASRWAERSTPRVPDAAGALQATLELARAGGASGVHLPVGVDAALARRLCGPDLLLGASAHSLAEAERAAVGGADYVTLSPIFASASKPGYGPPLGLGELARVASRVPIPVVALGGVLPECARGCLQAGAAGVAVMGPAMQAERPEALVALFRGQGTGDRGQEGD